MRTTSVGLEWGQINIPFTLREGGREGEREGGERGRRSDRGRGGTEGGEGKAFVLESILGLSYTIAG